MAGICAQHLEQFGADDLAELQQDAVIAAVHDQFDAGLDAITDGEQSRFDFNLSFYGFIEGIDREAAPPRRFGPPLTTSAETQNHRPTERAGRAGAVAEFERLKRVAGVAFKERSGTLPTLKASIPGPYTLSGRMLPNAEHYKDRWEIAEALLPIVSAELTALVQPAAPKSASTSRR